MILFGVSMLKKMLDQPWRGAVSSLATFMSLTLRIGPEASPRNGGGIVDVGGRFARPYLPAHHRRQPRQAPAYKPGVMVWLS